jgi:replicative DNA helicase
VTTDRVPPQDLDAERSVLGSIVLGSDGMDVAGRILHGRDFYSLAHRAIWEACGALHEKGIPVDLVTLRDELRRRETLEKAGGYEGLLALLEVVPSAANVEHYAGIVREKALRRDLIDAGNTIATEGFDDPRAADELVDLAETRVLGVARESQNGTSEPIHDVLLRGFEAFETKRGNTGLKTGFIDLDDLTQGLHPGEFVVLAGRPSMGKSSLALNIAEHVGVEEKKSVLVFSLEVSRDQVAQNMLCSHAEVDSMKLRRGAINPLEMGRLVSSATILAEAPIHIDDTPNLTTLELRSRARRLHRTKGLGLIVLDYLQLVECGTGRDRVQDVSRLSRALKLLARELEVPLIAVAQLSRSPEAREDHRPRMSDLRESGGIEADADTVLLLYREEYYRRDEEEHHGKAELIVAKQRNGPTGTVHLHFGATFTRFRSLTRIGTREAGL